MGIAMAAELLRLDVLSEEDALQVVQWASRVLPLLPPVGVRLCERMMLLCGSGEGRCEMAGALWRALAAYRLLEERGLDRDLEARRGQAPPKNPSALAASCLELGGALPQSVDASTALAYSFPLAEGHAPRAVPWFRLHSFAATRLLPHVDKLRRERSGAAPAEAAARALGMLGAACDSVASLLRVASGRGAGPHRRMLMTLCGGGVQITAWTQEPGAAAPGAAASAGPKGAKGAKGASAGPDECARVDGLAAVRGPNVKGPWRRGWGLLNEGSPTPGPAEDTPPPAIGSPGGRGPPGPGASGEAAPGAGSASGPGGAVAVLNRISACAADGEASCRGYHVPFLWQSGWTWSALCPYRGDAIVEDTAPARTAEGGRGTGGIQGRYRTERAWLRATGLEGSEGAPAPLWRGGSDDESDSESEAHFYSRGKAPVAPARPSGPLAPLLRLAPKALLCLAWELVAARCLSATLHGAIEALEGDGDAQLSALRHWQLARGLDAAERARHCARALRLFLRAVGPSGAKALDAIAHVAAMDARALKALYHGAGGLGHGAAAWWAFHVDALEDALAALPSQGALAFSASGLLSAVSRLRVKEDPRKGEAEAGGALGAALSGLAPVLETPLGALGPGADGGADGAHNAALLLQGLGAARAYWQALAAALAAGESLSAPQKKALARAAVGLSDAVVRRMNAWRASEAALAHLCAQVAGGAPAGADAARGAPSWLEDYVHVCAQPPSRAAAALVRAIYEALAVAASQAGCALSALRCADALRAQAMLAPDEALAVDALELAVAATVPHRRPALRRLRAAALLAAHGSFPMRGAPPAGSRAALQAWLWGDKAARALAPGKADKLPPPARKALARFGAQRAHAELRLLCIFWILSEGADRRAAAVDLIATYAVRVAEAARGVANAANGANGANAANAANAAPSGAPGAAAAPAFVAEWAVGGGGSAPAAPAAPAAAAANGAGAAPALPDEGAADGWASIHGGGGGAMSAAALLTAPARVAERATPAVAAAWVAAAMDALAAEMALSAPVRPAAAAAAATAGPYAAMATVVHAAARVFRLAGDDMSVKEAEAIASGALKVLRGSKAFVDAALRWRAAQALPDKGGSDTEDEESLARTDWGAAEHVAPLLGDAIGLCESALELSKVLSRFGEDLVAVGEERGAAPATPDRAAARARRRRDAAAVDAAERPRRLGQAAEAAAARRGVGRVVQRRELRLRLRLEQRGLPRVEQRRRGRRRGLRGGRGRPRHRAEAPLAAQEEARPPRSQGGRRRGARGRRGQRGAGGGVQGAAQGGGAQRGRGERAGLRGTVRAGEHGGGREPGAARRGDAARADARDGRGGPRRCAGRHIERDRA